MAECDHYGRSEDCPVRYKCYPLYSSENGEAEEGFSCRCDRVMTYQGESCSSAHPVSYIFNWSKMMVLLGVTLLGFSVLSTLLKRRYAVGRRTPRSAILTAAAVFVGNIAHTTGSVNDCIRILVGNQWFEIYGYQFLLQVVVFSFMFATLSVSYFFCQKVAELGIIKKKTLRVLQAFFIGLQLVVTVAGTSIAVHPQSVSQDRVTALCMAVAGVCTVALWLAGTTVQRLLRRRAAPRTATISAARPQPATPAELSLTRLTLFTDRHLLSFFCLVLSEVGWSYCDLHGRTTPALLANFLFSCSRLAVAAGSYNFYRFLVPDRERLRSQRRRRTRLLLPFARLPFTAVRRGRPPFPPHRPAAVHPAPSWVWDGGGTTAAAVAAAAATVVGQSNPLLSSSSDKK